MGNILKALHTSRLDKMLPGMLMGGLTGAAGGAYLGGGQYATYSPLGVPTINDGHRVSGALLGGATGALLGALPGHLKHEAVTAFKGGVGRDARAIGKELGRTAGTRDAVSQAVRDASGRRLSGWKSFFHPGKTRKANAAYSHVVGVQQGLEQEANTLRNTLREARS